MVETNVSQSAKAAGKDVLASAANITGNTAKTVSNLTDAVVKFSDIELLLQNKQVRRLLQQLKLWLIQQNLQEI